MNAMPKRKTKKKENVKKRHKKQTNAAPTLFTYFHEHLYMK